MKNAVITGAGSGIGASIASHLDRLGFQVALLGRDLNKLNLVAKNLKNNPVPISCDIRDSRSVTKACENIKFEKIDLLVNNAGMIHWGSFIDSTEEDWADQMQTNFLGAARLTQALLPKIKKADSPLILNISSNLSHHPIPNTAMYAATKGAMNSWSAALALELAPQVRVNTICPGVVETPIHDFFGKSDEKSLKTKEAYKKISPLHKIGQGEDIAQAVEFLIKSQWLTGQVITVDGGSTVATR